MRLVGSRSDKGGYVNLVKRTKSAGRWLDLDLGVRVQVEAGGRIQIPATLLHPLAVPLILCATWVRTKIRSVIFWPNYFYCQNVLRSVA
jgi:hypothetical protein